MKYYILLTVLLFSTNAYSIEITKEAINEMCILNYDIYNGCYASAKDLKPVSNAGCVDVTKSASGAIRGLTEDVFKTMKWDTTNEETFAPILAHKDDVCMDACSVYLKKKKIKTRSKYIADCVKNY